MISALTWAFFFFILYFEVLLLIGFVERLRKSAKETTKGLAYHPKVEIVVPCYNEQHTVAATIRSILSLEYPKKKLRVHVVNDGSTDGTREALKEFQNHPQVIVSHKENGGKHTALNYAIERSNADIIGCLDADSFVDSMALVEILKVFENTEAMAVTPAIKIEKPDSFFRYMQKAEYEVGILFRRIFADANAQFITPGPFSLYRKEVFETIGKFRSAHNTEDLEMGLRLQEAGKVIENAPRAVVYTRAPKTFHPLFKQRVRWAYGFLRNTLPYKHLFFNPKNIYLGFFILPLTLVSIFAAAYMPIRLLSSTAHAAVTKAVEFQTIGFSAFYFNPLSIDWYTFTPSTIVYVTFALFVLTAVLVLAGKYIGGEKVRLDRGIVLYIFLYGIFGPLWLSKAVFDAIVIRKNSWR
ncbi:MAG: glycosyltransferase [Patescibacteria group bacterium UBA2103]